MTFVMPTLLALLRYVTIVYSTGARLWRSYKYPLLDSLRPHSRYYLSDDHTEFFEEHTRVPENCVYIEEWVASNGSKKCVVRYEGEEIPKYWRESPFDRHAKCPWVWVGDRDTEIDLTRTFNKFLVVGNRITLDLIIKLIQVTERSNLIYIESGTFKELKFPGDGVTIKSDADDE